MGVARTRLLSGISRNRKTPWLAKDFERQARSTDPFSAASQQSTRHKRVEAFPRQLGFESNAHDKLSALAGSRTSRRKLGLVGMEQFNPLFGRFANLLINVGFVSPMKAAFEQIRAASDKARVLFDPFDELWIPRGGATNFFFGHGRPACPIEHKNHRSVTPSPARREDGNEDQQCPKSRGLLCKPAGTLTSYCY